jgi:hypothetical protein
MGWKKHKKSCKCQAEYEQFVLKMIETEDNVEKRCELRDACDPLKKFACDRCKKTPVRADEKWLDKKCLELEAAVRALDWETAIELVFPIASIMDGDTCCFTMAKNAYILDISSWAITTARNASQLQKYAKMSVKINTRRVELLGKMHHYRDQGVVMCTIADDFVAMVDYKEATIRFQTARTLAEKHGFFLVEFNASLGLGRILCMEDTNESVLEGLRLIRNAVAASTLTEEEDKEYFHLITALHHLTDALLELNPDKIDEMQSIDELQSLVPRLKDAITVWTQRMKRFCHIQLTWHHLNARISELQENPGGVEEQVREMIKLVPMVTTDVVTQSLRQFKSANKKLKILSAHNGNTELIESMRIICSDMGQRIRVAREA